MEGYDQNSSVLYWSMFSNLYGLRLYHLPSPSVSCFTNSTALSMLLESVKFSITVFSEMDVQASSSRLPFSVRHAAMTWNPLRSSCLASKFPNPLSHPVMKTCFPFRSFTLRLSRMSQQIMRRSMEAKIPICAEFESKAYKQIMLEIWKLNVNVRDLET